MTTLYLLAHEYRAAADQLADLELDDQTTNIARRFWPKVQQCGHNDCWHWLAYIDPKGYGRLRVGGRMQLASRVSYELHFGQVPSGLLVCHRCDVRRCVNPAHLFVGTYQDNVDDMHRKGRGRKASGEANGSAKLTDAQVVEIRSGDESLRKLAARMGVSYGHVGKIRRGEWRK